MALEGILINGASELLKKLIIALGSEISLARGVKDELERLKETLEEIEAKTSDAESKQTNNAVSLWLKKLKNVSYDADDVLDEYSYEALRRAVKNSKVKDFFSSSNQVVFRFKMAYKIKGINTQFNRIATDMKRFNFETTSTISGYQRAEVNRQTTSFIGNVSKFVGREADKSKIVRMLTTESITSCTSLPSSYVNSNTDEKVSVISIVGMGGLGKTSLAQAIYNDKSVENHFMKRIWVCISDDFDVFKILKNIFESATESKCKDFNPQVLVEKVREEIEGKKYLLVLDDLWNEDPIKWDNLKGVLDFGSVGSKIIVTTRSQGVASVVQGLIPPYDLNVLSEAECWSIIKNKAFSPGGASETPAMEILGKEIAKKCGGLPLAANFFGCHMHSHRNERDWLSIRDNQSLETLGNHSGGIIPILKLSYDSLPSHLKQCFAYCCLFPKDWRYERETLIRLWIAEGFVHPSNGGNQHSLENIANDYFLYLFYSSFFQDVERDDELGDIETFKMHDLVHDLALSVVSSHEVRTLNASKMNDDVSQIRRLRLTTEEIPKNAKKLRTIFFQEGGFVSPSPSSNKHLRVIYRLLEVLPFGASSSETTSISTSISFSSSNFKHMRYLDLRYCNLKDIHAESIHQLYNLQTLNLHQSKNVQNILKEGIGSLINLRHLDLSSSDANLLPTNIGHLQNLSSFNICDTQISELPDSICLLCNLTKFNFIVCHQLESLPLNFGALTQLRSLDFRDNGITELPESLTSNICKLEYVNLGNWCKYPQDIKNWVELRHLEYVGMEDHVIMPRSIEKLTRLEKLRPYYVSKEDDVSIDACRYNSSSSSIHRLADLNSLQSLWIVNLKNVRGGKIEAEMAKLKDKQKIQYLELEWNLNEEEEWTANNSDMVLEGLQPHPNLKELKITGFPGLKSPKWMGASSCLPNLVELKFEKCKNCEKLVGLGQLPCLQILKMFGLNSLKCLGKEFYYQQQEEEDEIKGFAISTTTTTTTTLFPSLTYLQIYQLENLEEWFAPDNSFPCLETVVICRCGNLTYIPDLRLCTSSLKYLHIRGSEKLEKEPLENYLDKYLQSVKYEWA